VYSGDGDSITDTEVHKKLEIQLHVLTLL